MGGEVAIVSGKLGVRNTLVVCVCVGELSVVCVCVFVQVNSYVVSIFLCVCELNFDVCVLLGDSPLYAVNMFCFYWLIKKLLWPMAGQNVARWEIQTEIQEERRGSQEDVRSCWNNKMYQRTGSATKPRNTDYQEKVSLYVDFVSKKPEPQAKPLYLILNL